MRIPRSSKTNRALFLLSHITFLSYSYYLGLSYVCLSLFLGVAAYNIAAQVFMHRSVAHGHFHFSDRVKKVLCVLFSFCNFGSLAVNCGIHRQHHEFCDTDLDPHNFRTLGVWRTILKDWDNNLAPPFGSYKDILREDVYRWQHRNHVYYSLFSSLALPFIPVCSFWLVNLLFIVAHTGSIEGDSPVNIPALYPLMWGEELHKDHHDFPGKKKMHPLDLMHYLGEALQKEERLSKTS